MAISQTLRLRALAILLAGGLVFVTGALIAQETGEGGEESAEPATGTDTEGEVAEPGLSEEQERLADLVGAEEEGESGEYGQEEDDDFVPTQEVSSDQSVNFPVDI